MAKRIVTCAPPPPVGGGRHAQQLLRSVVETAARVVARLIDGLRDRTGAPQLRPHLLGAQRGGIGFGRHAGDGLEHPVHMESTHLGQLGQLLQAGRRLGRGDVAAQPGHQLRVLDTLWRLLGLAALAGAKAGLLGRRARLEETHVLGPRCAGAARGTAVHPRRLDRVKELPIGLPVARNDRSPTGIGHHGLCQGLSLLRHDMVTPFIQKLHVDTVDAAPASSTPGLAFEFASRQRSAQGDGGATDISGASCVRWQALGMQPQGGTWPGPWPMRVAVAMQRPPGRRVRCEPRRGGGTSQTWGGGTWDDRAWRRALRQRCAGRPGACPPSRRPHNPNFDSCKRLPGLRQQPFSLQIQRPPALHCSGTMASAQS